jgi:hypothetical protein
VIFAFLTAHQPKYSTLLIAVARAHLSHCVTSRRMHVWRVVTQNFEESSEAWDYPNTRPQFVDERRENFTGFTPMANGNSETHHAALHHHTSLAFRGEPMPDAGP